MERVAVIGGGAWRTARRARAGERVLRSASWAVVLGWLTMAACSEDEPPSTMTIHVESDVLDVIGSFVGYVPFDGILVVASADPAADVSAAVGDGLKVGVVADLSCIECYRIDAVGDGFVVHGDAPLGVQYGLAHLLELMGFRFFHPRHTRVPASLVPPTGAPELGTTFEPEMSVRGLHLHILHPIEAYYDFWVPGPDNLEGAQRTVDWIVKNRGNYVQFPGLEDVQTFASVGDAWRDHMGSIVQYAHSRGADVGLGVQIFSSGNLQKAFDLVDDGSGDIEGQIRTSTSVLEGLPFDQIALSFGEFFAEEPDAFLATLNLAKDTLKEVLPGVEVSANIHVGDDLRVTYMGEDLLYYFLVVYADPDIVPWVHTVMYYNLFEDAGGAYEHDTFSEHRDLLLDRLRNDQRVVYFPESAYWIAFDNSVPQYLPLYVRSRWLDMSEIRREAEAGGFASLDEHVLFSSGWEWGYWQHDVATLRAGYRLPADPIDLFREMFSPWGAEGTALAEAIGHLAEAQHTALIERRLAAYIAGRDAVIDLGDVMGIHSQPDRPEFEEVVAMTPGERAAFGTDVLASLEAFGDAAESAYGEAMALGLPAEDPWVSEVRDGMALAVHRARFVHAVFAAAAAHGDGQPTEALLAEADRALEEAHTVVAHRREHMHDPDVDVLTARNDRNATVYQYGYLREADTLCFWERERAQLRNLLLAVGERIPACVL